MVRLMSSLNAKFDIGFVNLKFPRTSSNDFANFLPPLVIIDFINELRANKSSDLRNLDDKERRGTDYRRTFVNNADREARDSLSL